MINYVKFVYEKYIYEDWSLLTKLGRIVVKPFWFIKSILTIIYSIVCFPLVLLHMKLDKHVDKILELIRL